MNDVASEHTNQSFDDNMPGPGKAVVHQTTWSPGVVGPHVWFKCPRNRMYCGVPALPSPPNSKGFSWTLTGDEKHPTLTPSVNCIDGCGWHGFIQNGKTVGV